MERGFSHEEIIRRIGTRNRVVHRHFVVADICAAENAGVVDGDIVAAKDSFRRAQVNRGGIGRIVDLAVNRRAENGDFTRSDHECRFAEPVGLVRVADTHINRVGTGVRVFGLFGQVVCLPVEGIEDGVAFIDSG